VPARSSSVRFLDGLRSCGTPMPVEMLFICNLSLCGLGRKTWKVPCTPVVGSIFISRRRECWCTPGLRCRAGSQMESRGLLSYIPPRTGTAMFIRHTGRIVLSSAGWRFSGILAVLNRHFGRFPQPGKLPSRFDRVRRILCRTL
jgi:hypothetical protein